MKSFYKVMAIIAACLLVLGVLLSGVAFACGVSAEATGGVIRLGRYIQIPVGWGHHDWYWDWDDGPDDGYDGYHYDSGSSGASVSGTLPASSAAAQGDKTMEDKSGIRKIELELGCGSFKVVSGDSFKVDITGLPADKVYSGFDGDEWKVEVPHGKTSLNMYHDVRGTVTIPADCVPEVLEIEIGAGELIVEGLTATRSAELSVGAGTMTVTDCTLANAEIDCGMGELVFDGVLTGRGSIDCGMGNVTVTTIGRADDYGAKVECGMGNVEFNGLRWAAVGNGTANAGAANYFDIECGMGNVEFNIREE